MQSSNKVKEDVSTFVVGTITAMQYKEIES